MTDAPLLIIGYGNELRRDDGVGPRLAARVAAWERPGVRCLSVHQLTPELADLLAEAREVIFVDASANGPGLRIQSLVPDAACCLDPHHSSPAALLSLCQVLYGQAPSAWLLTIAAPDLGHGEGLSSAAEIGLDEAAHRVRGWLDRDRG